MGIFNRLFGFRWSLYITRNGKHLVYALHDNSPVGLAAYVMNRFANGKEPIEPWSLYLNFNHTHKNIRLVSQHFTPDGNDLTPLLLQQIKSLDPGYDVRAGEPVFVEIATGKKLKMLDYEIGLKGADFRAQLEERLANINRPKDPTFYDVIDQVFGGNRSQ